MIIWKVKLLFLTLLFCLICNIGAFGQQELPGLDLMEGNNRIEIPFRYHSGYILLDIKIQGILPLTFIYDTGAEHTIIFEKHITDLLGFTYDSSVLIRGSDINSTIEAFISRGIGLQLKKLPKVSRDIVVLNENFLNLKEMTGVQIDGIVGGSFFRNLTVKIDYNKQKLILWHPDKFDKKLKNFSKHKIEVINNKPYIICTTQKPNNQEFQLKLLVDTGASLAYLVNTNSSTDLTPPKIVTPGSLGKGIGGNINGYKGKMKSLEIGDYKFDYILTHFQEIDHDVNPESYNERNGLIGNLLLERFYIVIDYMNQEMYLKPSANIQKKFKYNLSGMELMAFGPNLNNYIVFEVLPNSPAFEAGIQKGDILKKLGPFKAKRYTLPTLDNILSKKEGKKINVILLREAELIEKSFILRDYLVG